MHVGHLLERIRTLAAVTQVTLSIVIALRLFGVI